MLYIIMKNEKPIRAFHNKAVAELFLHDLDLVADCYTIRLEECPEGFIDANGSPICADDVASELKEEK